jgi:hypothetical protein
MPPKGKKLSAEQIADFETWVKMGAPDPAPNRLHKSLRMISAKKHWLFSRFVNRNCQRSRKRTGEDPVDAFVLAKLESNGHDALEAADRRTLIRRAAFDLTGLPPSLEEVEAFVNDSSERAWEIRHRSFPGIAAVRRALGTALARCPRAMRIQKGDVFEEERRFPYSYTYRDYVINAFNEDLPFDRFIVEQIAADLLPLGED